MRRLSQIYLSAIVVVFVPCALAARIDLSRHHESGQFHVSQTNDLLTVNWSGERGLALRLVFNLGNAERLISELSVGSAPEAAHKLILKDAAPAYWVYTGRRHGSWEDNYFDNPSSRPHEINEYSSKLLIESCQVEDD